MFILSQVKKLHRKQGQSLVGSWLSLLPFLVVIPIAVLTRQVQPGLFAGLILGSYLVERDLFGGVKTLI